MDPTAPQQQPRRIGQEVTPVRSDLPLERLVPYLEHHIGGKARKRADGKVSVSFKGPVEVKQFKFGQSNPTYLLTDANGSRFVLRRRPLGNLISPTAHRLDREYLILRALSDYNHSLLSTHPQRNSNSPEYLKWKIPIPEVYCYCDDTDVVGAEFYVMEFLEGRIFEDVEMPEIESHAERRELWFAAIHALTLLSTLPPRILNLPPSFAPQPHTPPFFPRQVTSLLRVSAAQARTPIPSGDKHRNGRDTIGPIAGEEKIVPLLRSGAQKLAEIEKNERIWSVCAGDYKLDNLIFHPTEPKVIGILDWELTTLGSPLSDLANLLLPYSIDRSSIPPKFRPNSPDTTGNSAVGSNLLKGLKSVPREKMRIPGLEELEKAWVQGMNEGQEFHSKRLKEVGLEESIPRRIWKWPIEGLGWVKMWMLWRLAIIAQGISARAALGQASSAGATSNNEIFDLFGKLASELAEDASSVAGKDKSIVQAKL